MVGDLGLRSCFGVKEEEDVPLGSSKFGLVGSTSCMGSGLDSRRGVKALDLLLFTSGGLLETP